MLNHFDERNRFIFSYDYCGKEKYNFYYDKTKNELETTNESIRKSKKNGFMEFHKHEFLDLLENIEAVKNYLLSINLNGQKGNDHNTFCQIIFCNKEEKPIDVVCELLENYDVIIKKNQFSRAI